MTSPDVKTAAEMELLSPDERQRLVNDSVIVDLADVDPNFLARVRHKGKALLEERQVLGTKDR